MLTVATAALAVFLLGVALVLGVASMRRLALGTVACALVIGLAGATFAVVGQRRYERCIDRRAANLTGPLTAEERLELLEGQQSSGASVEPCERGAALGLHEPF